MSGRWSAGLSWLGAMAVAAVAFGLRAYRAGAQSFWYDEGISVSLAARSLPQITRDALADIHPPVYYYVLHFWTRLAGDGEFAVRFVSAAGGVVAACAVYALGARLFNRGAGLVAAAFIAVAPVLVYYGQEARMYSLLLALSAVWTLVLLRLLESDPLPAGRRRAVLWTAYVALGLLCVYTHYFAFFLLGMHAVWVAANHLGNPRLLLRWAGAMAIPPLAFVPWAFNMGWVQLNTFQQWQAASPAWDTLVRMLDDYSLGHRTQPDETVRLGFAALLALGLVTSLVAGRRARRGGAFALLYLGVPVAAMLALNTSRSAYAARLVMLASPGLYLLFGAGIAGAGALVSRLLGQRAGPPAGATAGAVLLCLALAPLWGSLQGLYHDQRWQRDDYRGAITYLQANAKPGDAIVLDSPYQGDIVNLYFRGSQPQYPLPVGVPPDRARTEAALAGVVARHGGIWAVFWGERETDPEAIVERWLDSHAYKALDRWFGGVRLVHYLVARVGDRVPLDLRFGESIRLRGYAWLKQEGAPGEVLPLALFWEATAPVGKRYKVFVHLLDDQEKIWGQRDSEPAGGGAPTIDWKPGEEIEDRIGLPIQADAAPGTYQVEIGMYEYPSMERPAITDAAGRPQGNRVLVGPVVVK